MLDPYILDFGIRIADFKSMGQGAEGKEQRYLMLDS